MTDTPSYPGGQGEEPQPGGTPPLPPPPPPFQPQGQQPYQPQGQTYPPPPPPFQPQAQPAFPPGPRGYPQAPPPAFDQPGMYAGAVKPPIPGAVQTAVKLMYVGAALEVVGMIIALASTGAIRKAVEKAAPNDTTTQINNAVHASQAFIVIFALIGIGLWIWMAFKNRAGRGWARVLGTVFFGIDTLAVFVSLAEHTSAVNKILPLIGWVVALVIVVLLWRRDSTAYFKPQPQPGWG